MTVRFSSQFFVPLFLNPQVAPETLKPPGLTLKQGPYKPGQSTGTAFVTSAQVSQDGTQQDGFTLAVRDDYNELAELYLKHRKIGYCVQPTGSQTTRETAKEAEMARPLIH